MVELERRTAEHEELLELIAGKLLNHMEPEPELEISLRVDLLVNRSVLIEAKTIGEDAHYTQVSKALSQLLTYRFIYGGEMDTIDLMAVFSARPYHGALDLSGLLEEYDIAVAWKVDEHFVGTEAARLMLPALFILH